jgi:predicted CoA-binding protein
VAGFSIDKELIARGYAVSVVYLDEETSGATLRSLKNPVGGVIVAVPASQAEIAVRQALEAKISRVWLQQGSESDAAIKLCAENQITAIHGECVMMFADPVKSFHAFHRWINKIFGKLPA